MITPKNPVSVYVGSVCKFCVAVMNCQVPLYPEDGEVFFVDCPQTALLRTLKYISYVQTVLCMRNLRVDQTVETGDLKTLFRKSRAKRWRSHFLFGGVSFLSPPHYPDSCISPFIFLHTSKSQRINPKGRHDHFRRIPSSSSFIDHPSFDGM